MRTHRIDRLEGRFLEEVRSILLFEIEDPAFQQIALTRVKLAGDLGLARIYYEVLDPAVDRERLGHSLEKLGHHLRKQLARRINLKSVPKLEFLPDTTSDEIVRVERLLDNLQRENKVSDDKE